MKAFISPTHDVPWPGNAMIRGLLKQHHDRAESSIEILAALRDDLRLDCRFVQRAAERPVELFEVHAPDYLHYLETAWDEWSKAPDASFEVRPYINTNRYFPTLRTRIPATTLYVAARIEMDDRVKEAVKIATNRGIPILEVMRPELDRLAGEGGVHQGLALKVPPYEYAHAEDLLDEVLADDLTPLFVALDGITDPRNLGAIIRSTAAFGGQGVIVPQRRSVGVTAAAWKTSAGAAARVPVAMAPNLTQTLKALKQRGVFVLGLDAGGDVELPGLDFADRPIVVVVGSEGKGLSRLVTETCDAIVSIPISSATESLNAGIAASVTLYEIAKLRAEA